MLIHQFYQALGALCPAGLWPINSGLAPTITGPSDPDPPAIGDTLTCTTGIWSGAATITYAYQWCQTDYDIDDELVTDEFDNPVGVAIDGAITNSYEAQVSDTGEKLFCIVTGTNAYGSGVGYSNVTDAVPGVASTTFAFIDSVLTQSTDGNTFSTVAINTTGAGLLIIGLADYTAGTGPPAISDSKGNTWTALTSYNSAGSVVRSKLYYSVPTSVGASHTVTATGTGFYGSLSFAAFSGGPTVSLGSESGAGGLTASVTPLVNNEVVVVIAASDAGAPTAIDGGFLLQEAAAFVGGTAVGHGFAYLIQTTAAAAAPTWTISASDKSCAIACFKVT